MLSQKELQERDRVVIGLIKNYEKLSPYNRGRLSMLADVLREKYPEGNKDLSHKPK